jgi:tetratricopeptide (TPR) repeat protein
MYLRSFAVLLLAAALATVATAAVDPWVEVRTPHFTVISDAGEKQARHVATEFERMRAVFHTRFPGARVDAASPIIVLAVRDKKGMQALEPPAYLAKGQVDLAGLFLHRPDKNYVLMRLDVGGAHPYATIYHEYTHFITSRDAQTMPLWLNEGLAELYQTTEIRDKEVLLGQPTDQNVMLLRQNHLLPLATLLTVDYNSSYYHEENKGSIFYAESWALTHYLQFKDRHDHTQRIAQYLTLLGNKVDPLAAAAEAFGDLKVLEKNLANYVAQPTFPYLTSRVSTEVDESAFKVQVITPLQANAVRADFLAYDQREKESHALLDHILEQDPDNVSAYETLGHLALREHNLDDARKFYGRAVKLGSQNYLAHYQFASISMQARLSDDTAALVETSLLAAIKLNPEFAPAFDRLAILYVSQNRNLDQAFGYSQSAIQLEPSNVAYRINSANILLQMKRPDDAIAALQAAAKVATDPAQLAMVRRTQDSIEQYAPLREQQGQQTREDSPSTPYPPPSDENLSPPKPPNPADNTPAGARHTAAGTLSDVKCSFPAVMHLTLVGGPKPLLLRSLNYFKVAFSAANFVPPSDFKPCDNLDTMKAKVVYVEGAEPGAEGQILAIELRK